MTEKQNVIPPGLTRLAVDVRYGGDWSPAQHEIHKVVRYTAKNVFTEKRQYRLSDGREIGGKGRARPVVDADEKAFALRRSRDAADRQLFELYELLARIRFKELPKQTIEDLLTAITAAAVEATSTIKSLLASKDGAG